MPENVPSAGVMSALATVATVADVGTAVRAAVRELVPCQGATFVLRDGDHCFYADEDAVSPLWRGQRFPVDQCLAGWSVEHGATAAVEDVDGDPRIGPAVYRPPFVRSLLVVPVDDPAVAAIGAFWAARHRATATEVVALERLAALTAATLDRVGLHTAPWAPNFATDV